MSRNKEIPDQFTLFGLGTQRMEEHQQQTNITPKSENCLNCGFELNDRWCAHCGQDSKEFKRSVWQVFFQFFETFTDFDSKLWSSLGPLIVKPGFLTKEFLAGRRKSYLNPIQMYAFFSFLFFLTAFYMPDLNHGDIKEEIKKELLDSLEHDKETSGGAYYPQERRGGKSKDHQGNQQKTEKSDQPFEISGIGNSVKAFDSIQAALPPEKRYGMAGHFVMRRLVRLNERFKDDHEQMVSEMVDGFKANLPNLVIVLLPIVALVLKLLFLRRNIYYVEHLIMAIHFHCFAFFLLSIWYIATSIVDIGDWGLGLSQVVLFIYLYKTFRNVYQQSRFKTFVKVNLLGISYTFLLGIGMVMNLFLSALLLA